MVVKNKNVAKCKKCGDIINSVHRHDFVTCSCGAISIDGGSNYMRKIGNSDDFAHIYVYRDLVTGELTVDETI